MESFSSGFSFTLGVVFALTLFPLLLAVMTAGLPNVIMGAIDRWASRDWKVAKWRKAVARGDVGQMDFLRKWGWDRIA